MTDVLVLGEPDTVLKLVSMAIPPEYVAELTELYFHKASAFTIEMPEDYREGYYLDRNNVVTISSMSILNGMRMTCRCASGSDYPEDEKADKVLLVEEFPFTRDSFVDYVNSIVPKIQGKPLANICIVFVDANTRRFGATDIDGMDKVRESAPEKIMGMLDYDVRSLISGCFWCNGITQLMNILKPSSSVERIVTVDGDNIYREWCASVLDEEFGAVRFELRIVALDDIRTEYLDNNKLEDNVYGYNCTDSCDDLLKSYTDRFYENFYLRAEEQLISFYSKTIKDICFWNQENDIRLLSSCLRNAYFQTVCPPDHNKVGFYKNAESRREKNIIAYTNLLTEKQVKDDFLTNLDRFFSDDGTALTVIMDRLCEKAKKIMKARENRR